MGGLAIQTENLGKRYRIGARLRKRTFREMMMDTALAPVRRLRSFGRSSHRAQDSIWALRDVTLEVKPGEVLGVIGRNAAGKTTLLKLLARITDPTEGRAVLHGRVGSLLEVGTGFHSELTGRENVFLSGAILGMKRAETKSRFDEIVDFSGVEKFIDTPVKRYSSGMRVRLGFAVAAHLEPEILLIDEVLAVGDITFQKKCVGKMGDVSRSGRTILFVSHNLSAVVDLCPRSILLEGGLVVQEGLSEQVVQHYLASEPDWTAQVRQSGIGPARVLRVECLGADRAPRRVFTMGNQMTVRISYEVDESMRVGFWLAIAGRSGVRLFGSYGPHEGHTIEREPGRYTAELHLPRVLMNAGTYALTIDLRREPGQRLIQRSEPAAVFDVLAADVGGTGAPPRAADGMFWLDHEWRMETGQ